MTQRLEKLIVVPIDGSENALRSLAYINRLFGPEHSVKVSLVYFLPKLPPILVEEGKKDPDTMRQLLEIEKKNKLMAERILADATSRLVNIGFGKDSVDSDFRETETSVARGICRWAEELKKADAIVISSRGRSRLEVVFTGEVANKVLECTRFCPIWMVKGKVKNNRVLLAIDNSENAMRAVDHAGFLLSGTGAHVTLFHSKRNLRRFVPKELLQEFPEIQKFWQTKAGEFLAPYIEKAREMLLRSGIDANRIAIKMVDGSRSAAKDILEEAQKHTIGTIILGRNGLSDLGDTSMGSITKKVLDGASDMTICIVP
jgi:nucleotide-binding universal stress UspA family protein